MLAKYLLAWLICRLRMLRGFVRNLTLIPTCSEYKNCNLIYQAKLLISLKLHKNLIAGSLNSSTRDISRHDFRAAHKVGTKIWFKEKLPQITLLKMNVDFFSWVMSTHFHHDSIKSQGTDYFKDTAKLKIKPLIYGTADMCDRENTHGLLFWPMPR